MSNFCAVWGLLGADRVQERKRGHLYPWEAVKKASAGYRRGKEVICTRGKRKIKRRPGTGEEKWSSVPVGSRKMTEKGRGEETGRRVRQQERRRRYMRQGEYRSTPKKEQQKKYPTGYFF